MSDEALEGTVTGKQVPAGSLAEDASAAIEDWCASNPARDEFFRILDECTDLEVTPWQRSLIDRLYSGVQEWDAPAGGDVLPNGMPHRLHATIDRSAGRALNIGRH